jgi:hypothetical protein
MLPVMETVKRINNIERKKTIRMMADWRLNKLLAAIFSVNLDLESALNLFPSVNPKYCMGERAAIGESLEALSRGFNPNIKPKTKNATKTNGAYQKLSALG